MPKQNSNEKKKAMQNKKLYLVPVIQKKEIKYDEKSFSGNDSGKLAFILSHLVKFKGSDRKVFFPYGGPLRNNGITIQGTQYGKKEVAEIFDNWEKFRASATQTYNQAKEHYNKHYVKEKSKEFKYYFKNDPERDLVSLFDESLLSKKIKELDNGDEILINAEGESFVIGLGEPSKYDLYPSELAAKFIDLPDDKKVTIRLLSCNSAVDLEPKIEDKLYSCNFARDFSKALALLGKTNVMVLGYTGTVDVKSNGDISSCSQHLEDMAENNRQVTNRKKGTTASLSVAQAGYCGGRLDEIPKRILTKYASELLVKSEEKEEEQEEKQKEIHWKVKYVLKYTELMNDLEALSAISSLSDIINYVFQAKEQSNNLSSTNLDIMETEFNSETDLDMMETESNCETEEDDDRVKKPGQGQSKKRSKRKCR